MRLLLALAVALMAVHAAAANTFEPAPGHYEGGHISFRLHAGTVENLHLYGTAMHYHANKTLQGHVWQTFFFAQGIHYYIHAKWETALTALVDYKVFIGHSTTPAAHYTWHVRRTAD